LLRFVETALLLVNQRQQQLQAGVSTTDCAPLLTLAVTGNWKCHVVLSLPTEIAQAGVAGPPVKTITRRDTE
jgi:hypothetical protein